MAIALAALVAVGAVVKLAVLRSSPYPLGVDGYYYAIQLRALLEDGALRYPAAPGAFAWLLPFAAVLGPVLGAKVGAALGLSLAAVPAYLLGREAGASRGPALIGAALAAASVQARFLPTEFVKQGLGLTLALALAVALARVARAPSLRRFAVALGLGVAAVLTHKTAAPLALVLAVPGLALARRRTAIAIGALVGGLASVALVVGVYAVIARPNLTSGVVGALDPRLAVLALPGLRPLQLGFEVLLAAALALAALVLPDADGRRGPRALPRAVRGAVALALVLALPWLDVTDAQGLGFRLRLAAWITLGPMVAVVAERTLALVRPRPTVRRAGVALAILALIARGGLASGEGIIKVHPHLVSAMDALVAHVPPGAELVCPERQVVFAAAWTTRADVRLRPRAMAQGARYRLLPGAWMDWVSPDLKPALAALIATPPPGFSPPPRLHPTHADAMVLLDERSFGLLVAALSPAARSRLETWPIR